MTRAAKPLEGIYRRLSVRMYGDERFMRLTPLQASGQALWMYLLTGPHTGPIPGVFVTGKAAMAETLGWETEAFEKAFAEVTAEGLVEFDAKTRLWFIPNAIRHNMPANPNVVLSWRGPWSLLPECSARDRIAARLLSSLEALSEPFGKAFLEASGKALRKPLAKDSPKQEAGSRKQRTGSRKKASPSSAAVIPCPYKEIVEHYHQALPEQPRVMVFDGPLWEERTAKMREFWGWVLSSCRADGSRRAETREEALSWLRDYFERAAHNDFLMGRTERSPKHKNWKCDLDFLLTKSGMHHVIEKTEVAA